MKAAPVHHRCSRRRRAFTLLELVLVLMLITLVLAAAAPALGGWNRGRKLQNAADDLLSAARFARTEAIATAMPHRLEIDQAAGSYVVTRQEGGQWTMAPGEFGRPRLLSSSIRVRVERHDGAGVPAIEFYPNARISPASVQLTADWGEAQTLSAAGAAETLRRVDAGEVR